ncbi:MAG TPA: hypothetical protein VKR56_00390 [Candidatus Cybelea sp.]|nr:hypothetical protein [Candidatus Cybelea sp.]
MKPLSLVASVAGAAIIVLAGCSSAGSPSSALGYTGLSAAQPGAHFFGKPPVPFITAHAFKPHRDRSKSWFSPKLKAVQADRILFAVDSGSYDVYMYAIPSFALLGTITGLDFPQGACGDNHGNVWIAVTYGEQIVEYGHDGSVVNTLSDPTGLPVGCAYDRTTGNLAVTNIFNNGGSEQVGAVLIYPHATGTPTSYTDPDIEYYYSAGYDTHGNLFVDGEGYYPNYAFVLGELTSGSITTIPITGGTLYDPANVQWDNPKQRLLVGDQECGGTTDPEVSCVYSIQLAGSSGTITGVTSLNNSLGAPACDVVQTIRAGNTLWGGDFEYPSESGYGCSSGGSASEAFYRWNFHVGGNPRGSSANSLEVPDGVAISY